MEYGVARRLLSGSSSSAGAIHTGQEPKPCDSCEASGSRLIQPYWNPELGLCPDCCVLLAKECDADETWPAGPDGGGDPVEAIVRSIPFKLWHGAKQSKLRTKTTKKHWLCVGGPMHGAKLSKKWVDPSTEPSFQADDWLGAYIFDKTGDRYEWHGEEMLPPSVGPITG